MRSLIVTLALALPAVASASPKQGIVAPSVNDLRTAIRSALPTYKNIPKSQLQSKKFRAFINGPDYTAINLSRPLEGDGFMAAYVATKVYPNQVFVWLGKNDVSVWKKGVLPKF